MYTAFISKVLGLTKHRRRTCSSFWTCTDPVRPCRTISYASVSHCPMFHLALLMVCHRAALSTVCPRWVADLLQCCLQFLVL